MTSRFSAVFRSVVLMQIQAKNLIVVSACLGHRFHYPSLETIEWLVKELHHPEIYGFSCKTAESWSDAWNQRCSHYQTKSSIDSKPTQMQSPIQTLQGPMLNKLNQSNLEMSTNRNGYWKMTSPMGQLVLNFRPFAGGFKCDVQIQFFAYLFLGTTAMGKHLGS